MQRCLLATTNAGKMREFGRALGAVGIDVVGLDTLDDPPEVEETGATFEANARLKAEAISRLTSLPVLADDSGLEVDALDGAPGVLSARYGGPGVDDAGRNRVLLEAIADVRAEDRSARFVCALALARGGRTLAVFDGVVEGILLWSPHGENGFCYEPLCFHPPSGCTTAELSTEAKQRISHRGRAIAALLHAVAERDSRLAGL